MEPLCLSPKRGEGREEVRDQTSPKEYRYGKEHEKKKDKTPNRHTKKRHYTDIRVSEQATMQRRALEVILQGEMVRGLEHAAAHTAHTTHATHATTGSGRALLLRSIDNSDLSSTEEGGDTAGINQSGADNLQGVDDTGGNHVNILAGGTVVSAVEVLGVLVGQLADNDGALESGVLNNGAGRAADGALDDADTELLIEVGGLDASKAVGRGLKQSGTTTGEDTLLNGSASGVERVHNTVLLLTDLNLGGTANLDDGNTTGQLRETLLQLLLLVLGGGGVGHDTADLLAALRDVVLAALAVEDNGVLLGDGDGTSGAEHLRGELLKLDVELIGEDGTVGKDSKITEDALAVVTEAGGLDGGDLELATELVQNADGESLSLNVLGNDDQRAAEGGGCLKGGENILDGGDLLLGEQDEGLLELDLLGLGVGDEVGGGVATVEAHTLGDLELILQGLTLLHGDNTLLANTLHGGGDELANVGVTIGGDGGYLGDLLAGGDRAGVSLKVFNSGLDGSLDTAAQIHRVAASGNVLDGLGEDGAGEDSGGSGTVTSDLVGLGGNILDKAGTEVLELVLKLDGLGDTYTVLGMISLLATDHVFVSEILPLVILGEP